MPSLKDIRLRIKSVKNTQQITKAMKMVSAAKLRRAQDAIIKMRPYAVKLKEMLSNILAGVEGDYASPFTEVRPIKNVLTVVITSNKGLAGAFNSGIIRMAADHITAQYDQLQRSGHLELICVGRKGYEFFSRRDYKLIGTNHDLFSSINFNSITEVSTYIMDGYIAGKWDKVEIAYNEFKNTATQIRRVENFLPVSLDTTRGNAAHSSPSVKSDYIFEPGKVSLLDSLIPQILKMQFYRSVLESNASEHGARMVAMDKASTNADELLGSLKLQFNKARQASITKEILEIVGGAEALSS